MVYGRKLTILPLSYRGDCPDDVGRLIVEAHPGLDSYKIAPEVEIPYSFHKPLRGVPEDQWPLDEFFFMMWLFKYGDLIPRKLDGYYLAITDFQIEPDADKKLPEDEELLGRGVNNGPVSYISTWGIDPRSDPEATAALGLHELGHNFGLKDHDHPVDMGNGRYCPMGTGYNPEEDDIKYCVDCLRQLERIIE